MWTAIITAHYLWHPEELLDIYILPYSKQANEFASILPDLHQYDVFQRSRVVQHLSILEERNIVFSQSDFYSF